MAGEEGYYYFYNAHGDVVRLSSTKDGTVVKYQYDAFGTLVSVEGDADNSITYAGYQYDAESGLYYLNARYYDSTTARFLTEDTYGGSADDPLSLNRYTYCVNNPLRYTDPSGQFWGAVVKFVVGAVTEYVTQKCIEKRDTIDVKAVVYEGVVGGVTAVIGGVGGAAGKAEKTAKTVVKSAVKTGVKEAAVGFVEDVGHQVFVEDKSLDEVDYGQAAKAGATAGVTAMADEVLDAVAPKKQVSTKNKKKASQATGLISDAADGGPRPKADVLPEGKVKGTVGSAGKANVAAGNNAAKGAVTGNTKKWNISETVKAGSTDGISKNQKKVQSQTVGSALSENVTKAGNSGNRGILTGKLDKLKADERKVVEDLLSSGKDVEIIPKSNMDNIKTPDFWVNGVKTELKTLNGTSPNTPIKRIQEGFEQHASTVILDARKTEMTFDDAESTISRVKGILGELPGKVEIWTKQGIFRR